MEPSKLDKDFDYAMQFTRVLLLPLGLWPANCRVYQRFVRPAAIAICLFVMLFVIIPMCLFIAFVTKDLKIRLKLFGPLGFSLMSLFKYVMVIYHKGKVAECIRSMWLNWRSVRDVTERKIMMDNVRTGRLLIVACGFFMYGGGMPYVAVLPLTSRPTLRGNLTLRPLAYPSYFVIFDPQVRPIYDFVFGLHCVCGLVRYTVTCGIYSIAILSVMHICSQITITHNMLNKLVENFDYRLLGDIVSRHRHLLKLASRLEEIFNVICLFEVIGSTCIICFLGYYLITEYENREMMALITYFLLFLSFVFNIFILCYIGEILTEQCQSIGIAAYMTDWHRLPQREAKNIVLLIIRTQRPVYLTAGKLSKLSILSFSTIIKASASYLHILRTVIIPNLTM
ncbi:odorant receptor 4-like [Phymastichus coffea]|uniref:odorant receptor 4-like n=1 Tax=Phymastichus coffea TaxID=108790 RepID=UPI00273BE0C9|nr:odorant receptor 4-like [Phymastichus coffea]